MIVDRRHQPKALPDCSKKIKKLGWELFTCSVLAVLSGMISIGNLGTEGEIGRFAHAAIPVFLCVVTWGLATGIGLLRSWRWARISMLLFSSLPILLGILMAGGFLLLPRGDLSGWSLFLLKTFALVLTVIPIAIGLRWLSYFSQDSVKAHFRT